MGLPMAHLMAWLQGIEQVHYVKEANEPSAHNITALLTGVGEECGACLEVRGAAG